MSQISVSFHKNLAKSKCMTLGSLLVSQWRCNLLFYIFFIAKDVFPELPPVDSVAVFTRDDLLWVEWSTPKMEGPPVEYLLEWKSLVDESRNWQREPRNATKAFLKGEVFFFFS